ncbi:MAG: proline dehydrogenase family protein [Pseudomonadota bacterium]
MQTSRSTSFLARKYVAGETALAGVERVQSLLEGSGIRSSLFYMGEYVDSCDLVADNVAGKIDISEKLIDGEFDVHVSVDPTQIGHQVDPTIVEGYAERIAQVIAAAPAARDRVNCLMFDMEDASLNEPTIAVHNALQDKGLPVALTLQAYLKRTMGDLHEQIARGSKIRLVKGAFAAGPDVAFTKWADIKHNSRVLIDEMLSPTARENGFYPIIATHDTALQDYAIRKAEAVGWTQSEYEFEMLLGVREDVAHSLARRGQRIRLYVPFGRDWWPYAVRRIGENPTNAILLARSAFG